MPDLPQHGLEVAEAEYVAVIEELCVAAENRIKLALRSIEQHPTAVGGVVDDNGYDQLMDWAVYFLEYNAYMPPVEHGMTCDLCTANCILRCNLLLEFLLTEGSGYWEAVVNRPMT